jgi:hypothetical protein
MKKHREFAGNPARGVDKVFKTLAKLASSSELLLAKSENNWPKNIKMVSKREKHCSPGWRVGLYFYSPILNSTRIWRVIIRTPVLEQIVLNGVIP